VPLLCHGPGGPSPDTAGRERPAVAAGRELPGGPAGGGGGEQLGGGSGGPGARIRQGESGALWLLHGSYLQDWLSKREDSNWRVDPALGGASRAFGDIGVHWCDLMEFVTGHRIVRLTARTMTAFPERRLAQGAGAVGTEDAATVLFET